MKDQDLQELMDVGGGATGTTKTPAPVAKTATLPNSKKQGDMSPVKQGSSEVGYDEVQDTNSENNTAPTGDMSAKNKASIAMKEEMGALFADADLSEEFVEKAATIFEAAVYAKVESLREEMEEQYNGMLEEQVVEVIEELTTKVDDYMNYVVSEWMTDNEVAIESSLRSEISEEFIDGLKTLFTEHYINIPEEKVEVVEELASKVEELEERLNETLEQNIALNRIINENAKEAIFYDVSEGLATTQVDKFKTLAESVEFADIDSFKQKLELIKENYFSGRTVKQSMLNEESSIGEDLEPADKIATGQVANYVHAISRTVKK